MLGHPSHWQQWVMSIPSQARWLETGPSLRLWLVLAEIQVEAGQIAAVDTEELEPKIGQSSAHLNLRDGDSPILDIHGVWYRLALSRPSTPAIAGALAIRQQTIEIGLP